MRNQEPGDYEYVFFDLEFHVPEEDRTRGRPFKFNPYREDHWVLGGHFLRYDPAKDRVFDETSFWTWEREGERGVLEDIYGYFKESWRRFEDGAIKNIVPCGFGVSDRDVPLLFMRSTAQEVDEESALYDCYFNIYPLDLAHVTVPFFNRNVEVLYRKGMNRACRRFAIGEQKKAGSNVWELYDAGRFEDIMERTRKEVHVSLDLYRELLRRCRD